MRLHRDANVALKGGGDVTAMDGAGRLALVHNSCLERGVRLTEICLVVRNYGRSLQVLPAERASVIGNAGNAFGYPIFATRAQSPQMRLHARRGFRLQLGKPALQKAIEGSDVEYGKIDCRKWWACANRFGRLRRPETSLGFLYRIVNVGPGIKRAKRIDGEAAAHSGGNGLLETFQIFVMVLHGIDMPLQFGVQSDTLCAQDQLVKVLSVPGLQLHAGADILGNELIVEDDNVGQRAGPCAVLKGDHARPIAQEDMRGMQRPKAMTLQYGGRIACPGRTKHRCQGRFSPAVLRVNQCNSR